MLGEEDSLLTHLVREGPPVRARGVRALDLGHDTAGESALLEALAVEPTVAARRPQEGVRGRDGGGEEARAEQTLLGLSFQGLASPLLRLLDAVHRAVGEVLVVELLHGTVLDPAGEVVTLLALRLAATDGGAALLAVRALQPLAPRDLSADGLQLEPADRVRVLRLALLRQPGAEEQAELVGPHLLVAEEEVELGVEPVAELAGLR